MSSFLRYFGKKPITSTPAVKARRLVMPYDSLPQLCSLLDAFYSTPVNQDHLARYQLWSYISQFYPEIKEGSWRIENRKTLAITIVEVMET